MENFIDWLFSSFMSVIETLTWNTVDLIRGIFDGNYLGDFDANDFIINLSLFSDTPILTTNLYDFLLLIFSMLYTVVFVVVVWKIIKKIIVKITGWKKW